MELRSKNVPGYAGASNPDKCPGRNRKRFESAAPCHEYLQVAGRSEEPNETLKHPTLCQAGSLLRRLLNLDAPLSSHDQQIRLPHEQTVLNYAGNPVELNLQRSRIIDMAHMQIQNIEP